MALTRQSPTAIFEARAAVASAQTDEARTHLDHAVSAHLTAGRLHNHGIKAAATADRYRGIAAAARGKRQFDVADAYDKLAAEYSAAETFAAERAQSWHDRGGQHSTKARDADAPPVLEDDSAQTKTRSSLLRSK